MSITFFPIKYCVACKKSTLKVLINLGFVTSFEDSHYILLFRYIYGAQLIQWFCYSKHLHVNRNYRPNGSATSLSPKCYSATVPLDLCTTADFEMKYFFNEGAAGVLGNTNSFSRLCSQNSYLNSKLMLRWDGHFKSIGDILTTSFPHRNLFINSEWCWLRSPVMTQATVFIGDPPKVI